MRPSTEGSSVAITQKGCTKTSCQARAEFGYRRTTTGRAFSSADTLLASCNREPYFPPMSTVAEIEAAILELPQDSFLELFDRLSVRREAIAYESPELEAELLKAVDGPWHPVNEELYEGIRRRWQEKKNATTKTLQPC